MCDVILFHFSGVSADYRSTYYQVNLLHLRIAVLALSYLCVNLQLALLFRPGTIFKV